jgi:hypothetical protein
MNLDNISIFDIVGKSAESKLINVQWNYSGFTLKCSLPDINEQFNLDANQIISFEVKTNMVCYYFPEKLDNIICYFNLVDLKENICTNKWDYYSPAVDKDEYMRQLKKDFFIAFGTHSQKYRWIFQLIGSQKYFTALISKTDDIKFYLEK